MNKIADQFISNLANTLSINIDIKALLVFGSYAKGNQDQYSDLDFLLVVEDTKVKDYIRNLNWLTDVESVQYLFQEGLDCFKAILKNGMLCEFGIVSENHLNTFDHEAGKIIFCRDEFQTEYAQSNVKALPVDKEYLINEILFLLHIGLSRYCRGEKCCAFQMIQGEAASKLLSLVSDQQQNLSVFNVTRRYEQLHPKSSISYEQLFPGILHVPDSAKYILDMLVKTFPINHIMKSGIEKLYEEAVTR